MKQILQSCVCFTYAMLYCLCRHRGGSRTMMITGDYHQTAVSVARDVGMIKLQDNVVVIDIATYPQQPLDSSVEGLTFRPIAGVGTLPASEALASLAEGQMQCAVTGDALDQLLQHHDLSVLETVLRSAVVFSRMQPHQKGQVMDLLSLRGIHQLSGGQPRHIQVRPA